MPVIDDEGFSRKTRRHMLGVILAILIPLLVVRSYYDYQAQEYKEAIFTIIYGFIATALVGYVIWQLRDD